MVMQETALAFWKYTEGLGVGGIRSATYLQMQRKKGLYYSSTLSEMVEMVSNIYKEKKKGPIFSLSC